MGPLTFVIAIMGCSDAGTACQKARLEPVVYPTQAACQAATRTALEKSTDLPYPVLQAACVRTPPTVAQVQGKSDRRG